MKKPACAQLLSSDFSPLLFSWGSLLSTYSHTIRKSLLPAFTGTRGIFLPLFFWLSCFFHFLTDLGTILKCLSLSAGIVQEMCRGRPMVPSRAMPLCGAKPRGPGGHFPFTSSSWVSPTGMLQVVLVPWCCCGYGWRAAKQSFQHPSSSKGQWELSLQKQPGLSLGSLVAHHAFQSLRRPSLTQSSISLCSDWLEPHQLKERQSAVTRPGGQPSSPRGTGSREGCLYTKASSLATEQTFWLYWKVMPRLSTWLHFPVLAWKNEKEKKKREEKKSQPF